jgi:hypothetical protein
LGVPLIRPGHHLPAFSKERLGSHQVCSSTLGAVISISQNRLPGIAQDVSASESFCLGLIVAAALAAISYGFISSLDLVQHWDTFNFGVSRFFQ